MNKAIKCGKLFNSIDGSVSENQVVLVEGERIKDVVDEQGFCPEGYAVSYTHLTLPTNSRV